MLRSASSIGGSVQERRDIVCTRMPVLSRPTVIQSGSEPLPATHGGSTLQRRLKRYALATRPAFLAASLAPVILGTAAGGRGLDHIEWLPAILALLATLFVHAAANVLNDVADERSGNDRRNVDRIYPYTGGSRLIQNNVLTAAQMRDWGLQLLAVAIVIGLGLALVSGPWVIALGMAGMALGACYSLPPVQLVSRGLGELTIAIAFGMLPFCGAAWLQSGTVDGQICLLSVPLTAWVTAILLLNEVPDMAADRAAHKYTLPVRLGLRYTRWIYVGLQLVSGAAVVLATLLHALHPLAVAGAALLVAQGIAAAARIDRSDRARLRRAIEITLQIHMIGSLVLLAAICFAGNQVVPG